MGAFSISVGFAAFNAAINAANEMSDDDYYEDDYYDDNYYEDDFDDSQFIDEEDETAAETYTNEKNIKGGKDAISTGTYKVGEDIPAGEYIVFGNEYGYIQNSKDSTGEIDSIIFNDSLLDYAHAYVTLNDGEYFQLDNSEMYAVKNAPSVVPEDDIYLNGMYKVGQDIPAGEYEVHINNSEIEMGYLEISKDSSHSFDKIVSNKAVESNAYITLKDGQYLTLQNLYLEK